MNISSVPAQRGLVTGGLAALALTGTLTLGGCGNGSAAPSSPAGQGAESARSATLAAATGSARITVTGTGTVTGTPNQLVLDMGVQANGLSVGPALASADDAVSRVTAALRGLGVAAADIQTSGLSIWPTYPDGSQVPSGYAASESLTATLNSLSAAGAQIDAAVHAGGNATTVSGISLNLTDDSSLLAAARARAVADAEAKATQYAKALGEPLGPVVSITDQAPAQPLPQFAVSSPAASGKSVPISPGTQQLSVSITAVFTV
ncbi:MAG: uncharacterized protein QOG28_2669 [Trebonia sp.]|nr:uncharacterized protein [Trebonia sp.]